MKNRPSFVGKPMKRAQGRLTCFSDTELREMYKALESEFHKTKCKEDLEMLEYFIINSNLGLRPSEYYALVVSDIDFEKKTITISKSIKYTGGMGGTKNMVNRTLPIDGIVYETLRNIVQRIILAKETDIREAMKLYLLKELEGTSKELYRWVAKGLYKTVKELPLLKCPISGLTQKKVERRWSIMMTKIGYIDKEFYKDYVPYALRHTVASKLAGVKKFGAHKIMLYMGHTNIQTSMKYVHLNVDDIRDGSGVGIS